MGDITDLTLITSPDDDDLLYIVSNPGTTPIDQKIKWVHVKNMAGASANVVPLNGSENKLLWWDVNFGKWYYSYSVLRGVSDIVTTPQMDGTVNISWTNPGIEAEVSYSEHHLQVQYSYDSGDTWHSARDVTFAPGTEDTLNIDLPFYDEIPTMSVRIRSTDEFETTHSPWTQV